MFWQDRDTSHNSSLKVALCYVFSVECDAHFSFSSPSHLMPCVCVGEQTGALFVSAEGVCDGL